MAKLYDLIRNIEKDKKSLGYTVYVSGLLSKLKKTNEIQNNNYKPVEVLGLIGSKVTDEDVSTKFEGNMSTDDTRPYLMVQLSFCHCLPVISTEGGEVYLKNLSIEGETDYNVKWSNEGRKTVPHSLTKDFLMSSGDALGGMNKPFKVGCYLDISHTGVDYFNRFYPMAVNEKWTPNILFSLLNAGCLYINLFSNTNAHPIPLRVIGHIGYKSGQIKVPAYFFTSEVSEDINVEIYVANSTGGDATLLENKSTMISCVDGFDYNYLNAELEDFNPKNLLSKADDRNHSTSEVVKQYSQINDRQFFIRYFIPKSMRQKAEYAVEGLNFKIPDNLYDDSIDENYVKKYTRSETAPAYVGDVGLMLANVAKQIVYNDNLFNSGDTHLHYVKSGPSILVEKPKTDKNYALKFFKFINRDREHILGYSSESFVMAALLTAYGPNDKNKTYVTVNGFKSINAKDISLNISSDYYAEEYDFDARLIKPGDILISRENNMCGIYVDEIKHENIDINNKAVIGCFAETQDTMTRDYAPHNFAKFIRIEHVSMDLNF